MHPRLSNAASSANWWIWGLLGSSLVTGGGLGFYIVLGINGALKQSAAELTEGARQITSAAGQVASSSQSLAQGASEQAASSKKTSASIEEISSMTRRNAENSGTGGDGDDRRRSECVQEWQPDARSDGGFDARDQRLERQDLRKSSR